MNCGLEQKKKMFGMETSYLQLDRISIAMMQFAANIVLLLCFINCVD